MAKHQAASAGGERARAHDGTDSDIGPKLRAERERQGLGLRRLAARLDISPSALSQIELGRSRPSVRTLYAIVTELNISLDELLTDGDRDAPAGRPAAGSHGALGAGAQHHGPVTRKDERRRLDLESGAHWERLNPPGEREFDYMIVTYDVGGSSGPDGMFSRHSGREWGVILSGRMKVTVGFQEYVLEAGDSITFDSQTPHRLENLGQEPAQAVWFVIGRDSDLRANWNPATPPSNGHE